MSLLEGQYNKELELLARNGDSVVFEYFGKYDHSTIVEHRKKIEEILADNGEIQINVKKALIVFVETAQNAFIHGLAKDSQNTVWFTLSERDGKRRYVFCNLVDAESKEQVVNYLTWIESMSKEDARVIFIELLSKGEMTTERTGGLGLLIMAKSGFNISHYAMSNDAGDEHLFCIEIIIS